MSTLNWRASALKSTVIMSHRPSVPVFKWMSWIGEELILAVWMMRGTDVGNDRQQETRWNNEWWNLEIAFLLVTYLNNASVSRK